MEIGCMSGFNLKCFHVVHVLWLLVLQMFSLYMPESL